MKKMALVLGTAIATSLLLAACAAKPVACTDAFGCISVAKGSSIQIASLLTMTDPDSAYGIDAVRGVASQNPDVIYFPLYTDDGVALMQAIPQAGFSDPALISSDGLLSTGFIQKQGLVQMGCIYPVLQM